MWSNDGQFWLCLADGIQAWPTYSYKLRELANRRVRHELELHDMQCRGDGARGEIGGERVEAHGEKNCPTAGC